MPTFTRDDVSLYYEEHGEGFPILLFAAGGMRSAVRFWQGGAWDPIEVLSQRFRVISMDQRNAGQSTAPVTAADGWHSYTADHMALLDHLGIEQTHLMGACIGGPYCMGVIQAAPERVACAVLQQTIGFENNRKEFYEMFDGWANDIKESHSEADDNAWASFRSNMYDGDFLFNASRDFVKSVETPLLVLMGGDVYHPESTSREVAELAPNAELVEEWKGDELADQTKNKVLEFLQAHTPVTA